MQDLIRQIVALIFFKLTEIMISLLALLVSVFALVATIIQLYIQREHDKKSVKPLPQIDLGDHKKIIYVYIKNYGMGPVIINKLSFYKDGIEYEDIIHCLPFDPRSYMHISINKEVFKTVLPNGHFEIFEKKFYKEDGNPEDEKQKLQVRKCLSEITVTVYCTDIYDTQYLLKRSLNWFARDLPKDQPIPEQKSEGKLNSSA